LSFHPEKTEFSKELEDKLSVEKIIKESLFPHAHFTTTKACGNMKDGENRAAVLSALGFDARKLVLARQVHGSRVRRVSKDDYGKFIEGCDGLITDDSSISLGIFTADCVPVLMVSKDSAVKAAIHAGWKGLAEGIIENAADMFLSEFGIKPADIAAYTGPCIQECCYEVGPELESVFKVKLKNGHLNLREIAENLMRSKGISDIFTSGCCTFHEQHLFFSYRRDKTEDRHLTFLA